MDHTDALRRAADALGTADALLIGAGAGMGVDSGLPDFRGTQGFWRAYPLYEQLKLDFASMANPAWFARDPEFAWGFYGHRLGLYRQTRPHAGFALLRRWAERLPHGAFVFTSNVDGHFQEAGFAPEQVMEVHGSIHHMQCTAECGAGILPAAPFRVEIDEATLRARPPLPACPSCGALLRPNILMFGDAAWDSARMEEQDARMQEWLAGVPARRLVVIECGAGPAIPTVRYFCEDAALRLQGTLVRINVRDPDVPRGPIGIGIPMGARDALQRLHELAFAG